MALSHLGAGKAIANLDTENSEAASACRTFYDIAVEATLRDFDWPFATKIRALALIEEDPNDEWAYSYRYPTDCLKFRRILSGQRLDTRDTRAPYRIAQDASGSLIYTDESEVSAEYTLNMTDPSFYPADFVIVLSYRLAAYIAPRVAGADPVKKGEDALKKYFFELGVAQANASKEEQPDKEPDSEFVRVRE